MEKLFEIDHDANSLTEALNIESENFKEACVRNFIKYRKNCTEAEVKNNIVFDILTITSKADLVNEILYMLYNSFFYIERISRYRQLTKVDAFSRAMYAGLSDNYSINDFIASLIKENVYEEYAQHTLEQKTLGDKFKALLRAFTISKERGKQIIALVEKHKKENKKSLTIEKIIEDVDNYNELYFAMSVLSAINQQEKDE